MIGRRHDDDEGKQPATRVLKVMLAALLVAALLNGGVLKRNAEQMPFGGERDFWVAVWTPFAFVGKYTLLDQPRMLLDRQFDTNRAADLFQLPPSVQAPGTSPPSAFSRDGTTPAARQDAPRLRQPAAEAPLRLWVGGDSMAQVLGESLVRLSTETGLFQAELDYRISTGLTRPDYFDWPGHFNDIVTRPSPPEVMVVVFGGNDSQGLKTAEGAIYQPGEPGWHDEYLRRVAGIMDLLRADGRLLVWVGQPIMRSADFSERMQALNEIYSEAAATRPWVRFVPLYDLFADSGGQFNAYLPGDDGQQTLMRQSDGIHLSRAGGDRAANAILDAIYAVAGLPPRR